MEKQGNLKECGYCKGRGTFEIIDYLTAIAIFGFPLSLVTYLVTCTYCKGNGVL